MELGRLFFLSFPWHLVFFYFLQLLLLVLFADAGAAEAPTAAAAEATVDAETAAAAEAELQYLKGAGIRTRNSATADRCATNELHSPLRVDTEIQRIGIPVVKGVGIVVFRTRVQTIETE